MPPQEVRKIALAEPFVPFRLHVSDGSSYDVLHPIEIQVFPLQISIAIDPDDPEVPTTLFDCDLGGL